ncbi:MAG: glycosyltransferase family 4 protein [Verrucomicrobiae bacterium]|nr:glycosyltransferase family 4 protein [Verrucomicrobiae bacterium]
MRLLLVHHQHLDSNSGIHVVNLASHLSRLGVECVVCVPEASPSIRAPGQPRFEIVEDSRLLAEIPARTFDLIHAWTPREQTRRQVEALIRIHHCPYVVHLEDNEEWLISKYLHLPFPVLKRVPLCLLDRMVPRLLSHPRRYGDFLQKACGITVIMDSLKAVCPPGIPVETIWAGYQEDLSWDRTADRECRRRLGIAEGVSPVVYTGNVHAANRGEVAALYEAVDRLHRRGRPVLLIRTGNDYVSFPRGGSGPRRKAFCLELGHRPRTEIPSLLSLADVLVQPGMPGPFNDFRFPSKLPEFLASGKPVILPRTNIGLHLIDRQECLHLEGGSAEEIARKMEWLILDRSLRERIGAGGRCFAQKHLRWGQLARKMHAFYRVLLDRPGGSH